MKNILNILGLVTLIASVVVSSWFYIEKEAVIKKQEPLVDEIKVKENQYKNIEEEVRKILLIDSKDKTKTEWNEVLVDLLDFERDDTYFVVFDSIRVDPELEVSLSGRTNNFSKLSQVLKNMNNKHNILEKGSVFLIQHSKSENENLYNFDISARYVITKEEDNE